jgi:hypothetical protein
VVNGSCIEQGDGWGIGFKSDEPDVLVVEEVVDDGCFGLGFPGLDPVQEVVDFLGWFGWQFGYITVRVGLEVGWYRSGGVLVGWVVEEDWFGDGTSSADVEGEGEGLVIEADASFWAVAFEVRFSVAVCLSFGSQGQEEQLVVLGQESLGGSLDESLVAGCPGRLHYPGQSF